MATERTSPLRFLLTAVFVILLGVAWWTFYDSSADASEGSSASEFEAIGAEVGMDGLPSRIRHIDTGTVLVLIPPGRFTIGTPPSERERDGDEAQREVRIDEAFYLGETEVTVGQWKQVMGPDLAEHQDDEMPIGRVTWHKAQEFIDKLNEPGGGWRLPTEEEWEYACRAGTTTPFSFGTNITPEQANYRSDRPYLDGPRGTPRDGPVPVRSFPPNPWGLYEMHGNLWEWCEDRYVIDPERDWPEQIRGGPRVMRGGAFTSYGKQLRSGYRDGYPPNSSGQKYGFRLALSVGG